MSCYGASRVALVRMSENAVLVYCEYQSFLRLGCQGLLSTLVSTVWFKAGSKAPVPPHLGFCVASKRGEALMLSDSGGNLRSLTAYLQTQ